ncbi:unnamed protein product [Nippostrongylus brasiliensis]|uniref:Helicase SKI2W (inferred by orthology to a human protein) n=1 Tax=Nippostrongylus brasiliensis TaxID=27835 RepID=A0A158QXK6_NIPBR|nr:unnamed protein product [Nippostrongylus brasiliensis]
MKIIHEIDSLTDEWCKAGPQLFDLAEEISVSNIDLAEQRIRLLHIRTDLFDPSRYLARNCMRFEQHMSVLRERVRIERQVSRLQYSLSVDALQLSEEYQKRIELKADVQSTSDWIESHAELVKARIADVGDELRYDLMQVVYHWASGMPFSEIMTMTDAQEGLIVRCIQRLGEVCKDIRNAARIVGDPALHEKMEQVSAAIKRDIVFAASLYTSM